MSSPLENEVHLPLVDISQISLDFEGKQFQSDPVLATVREACEEWGFFCVVNHGIPPDFFQNVESLVRQLCTMSTEAKQKAATSNPTMSYSRTDYMDNFCFPELPHSSSVQEMCERIWAEDGNPEFCETIQKYILYVADLATKIAKMLIASLGLDVDAFYHSDFENWKSHLRINNYYPCDGRMSMEEEFPSAHTDIGLFTILYQVNEGGLQIRSKEGKWLNVKPLPHSFVINVADCFKAWSNGRYRSAEHRVVYKGWENRISLPYFVQFPPDKQILAPEELVDDDHPRRYRPFTFSHFKTEFYKDLDPKVKQPAIFIDTYAGI